jgi:hypothetical protein
MTKMQIFGCTDSSAKGNNNYNKQESEMIIKSLEQMEEIVKNNDNLSWDGWTVLENKTSDNGMMSKDGAFVNGMWIVQKRYEANASGWEIPNKLVG